MGKGPMKLKEIAELVGGTVQGEDSIEITDACGMDQAKEGDITFLKEKKFFSKLETCKASAVIVPKALEIPIAQVIHPNPALAFANILMKFHPDSQPAPGVSPQAFVDDTAIIGKDVTVSPFVSIGKNVVIGDHTVLFPGAVIYDDCKIGNHCTIHANVTLYKETKLGNHVVLHSGAVIGADGFGYTPDQQGRHFKIQQIGNVIIEDHVEIGANTCIDRATFGETVIRQGTKIDNLVQVAHNCEIGAHSILVSQVGMSGSCKLGHHVILAGQVGLADHVTLADQVVVGAQSGVPSDLPKPGFYGGSPAIEGMRWKKSVMLISKLPDITKQIRDLEKRLSAIENE